MADIKPQINPLGPTGEFYVNNTPDTLRGGHGKGIFQRNEMDLHVRIFRILQRLPKIRSDETMPAIDLAHIDMNRALPESKTARTCLRIHAQRIALQVFPDRTTEIVHVRTAINDQPTT